LNNLSITKKLKTIVLVSSVTIAALSLWADTAFGTYSEENIIHSENEAIVVSNFKSIDFKDGITVLSKDKKGIIVVGEAADYLVNFAADEIREYVKISMGIDVDLKRDSEINKKDYKSYLILLGNLENNSLIKKLKVKISDYDLGDGGYLIKAFKNPFNKGSNALVIAGSKSKGTLNGAYAFLNKAMSIEWFPPRIHRNYMEYFTEGIIYEVGYHRISDEQRFQVETYIENRELIKWPEKEIVEKPVVKDVGMLFDKLQFCKAVVDWSIKNKLNTIVVYVEVDFPLPKEEETRLIEMVKYAQKHDIRVYFITFTFITSKNSREVYPDIYEKGGYIVSNPRTKEESTKLMMDIVRKYGIDGIGFHPASERIDRTWDEERKKYYWETAYVTHYYNEISKFKPDAKIFLVLGWEYMNPPQELRDYLPKELIAWIVPSRDWTRKYIKGYFDLFPCWFWLYPFYSHQGVFPNYSIDRMKKYVKEAAVNNILGIVPEMYMIRNHEMNLMSLIKFYWDPDKDTQEFIKDFFDKYYYHAPRANEGVKCYMEGDYMRAYNLFRDSYIECNNAMVRDRLKDMAISSLRLIKDMDEEKMYTMCEEAKKIFAEHYLSNEKTDLFYVILTELQNKWRDKVSQKEGGKNE